MPPSSNFTWTLKKTSTKTKINGTGARKISFQDDDRVNEVFGLLQESGAIEWVGLDLAGEPVYRLTDKCQEVFPELYEMHKAELSQTANELWQMGVIDMVFRNSEEAVVFTQANYLKLKEVLHELTPDQLSFLVAMGAPIRLD